ncbi:hypothetical protein DUNSADRAFT_1275 [Dunaliella salina]|uniref:Encoded protein n=1 Tax=Dunaliella salina TaxID=3046 RepID=A0ABQ7GXA8_DUNSA|nr:hypothetical protein DUNSADRAFT_1275 [Dunaliella salina]|eukprot:KAF5839242.1 hypothetical protein DUNSADRAFT_1275 [Dunaliella salina]
MMNKLAGRDCGRSETAAPLATLKPAPQAKKCLPRTCWSTHTVSMPNQILNKQSSPATRQIPAPIQHSNKSFEGACPGGFTCLQSDLQLNWLFVHHLYRTC